MDGASRWLAHAVKVTAAQHTALINSGLKSLRAPLRSSD
jgi:hypothetical protein